MAAKPIYVAADVRKPRDRHLEVYANDANVRFLVEWISGGVIIALSWEQMAALIEAVQANWPAPSTVEAVNLDG